MAIFSRRHKPHWLEVLQDWLWPKSGWRRRFEYLYHRIGRMDGSGYSVAAGVACGVAISFTPLIGGHLAFASLFAWIIGGNIIAAWLGTLAGNPWTFPFIWVSIYETGCWILGKETILKLGNLSFQKLFDHVWELFIPMVIGSIPFFIISWFVVYRLVRRTIITYQYLRHERRGKGWQGKNKRKRKK